MYKPTVMKRSAVAMRPQAIFGSKKAAVLEPEVEAPKKKALFTIGGSKPKAVEKAAPAPAAKKSLFTIGGSKKVVEEPTPAPAAKKSLFTIGGSKKKVEEPVPEAPKKKGLFTIGGSKKAAEPAPKAKAAPVAKKAAAPVKKAAAEAPRKKTSFFSQTVQALDFQETANKSDADLIDEAKYGELKNGKLTQEQYAALRRRITGTKKGFFKEWVDVEGEYTEKGFVAKDKKMTSNTSSGALIAGVVALGLVGATLYAVLQL